MKRKEVHIEEDDREAKRVKLDEPVEGLSSDVVQLIFKSLDDKDFIRCARVSKTWNKASIRERNRFIDQRITWLKMMHGRSAVKPLEFKKFIGGEWDRIKSESELLTRVQTDWMKEPNATGAVSVVERFKIWRRSLTPKTHFHGQTDVVPKGEKSLFDMSPFKEDCEGYNKGKTFNLDDVLSIIEEDLGVTVKDLKNYDQKQLATARELLEKENEDDTTDHINNAVTDENQEKDKVDDEIENNEDEEDEDSDDYFDLDECKLLITLEKYLEKLIDMNFGSFVNDW